MNLPLVRKASQCTRYRRKRKSNHGFTGLLNFESLCPNGVQEENDEKKRLHLNQVKRRAGKRIEKRLQLNQVKRRAGKRIENKR